MTIGKLPEPTPEDPEIAKLSSAERQALELRLKEKLMAKIRERETITGVRYLVAVGRVEDIDPVTKERTWYTVRVGVHENAVRQVIRERRREEGITGRQWVKKRKAINKRHKAKTAKES